MSQEPQIATHDIKYKANEVTSHSVDDIKIFLFYSLYVTGVRSILLDYDVSCGNDNLI